METDIGPGGRIGDRAIGVEGLYVVGEDAAAVANPVDDEHGLCRQKLESEALRLREELKSTLVLNLFDAQIRAGDPCNNCATSGS